MYAKSFLALDGVMVVLPEPERHNGIRMTATPATCAAVRCSTTLNTTLSDLTLNTGPGC